MHPAYSVILFTTASGAGLGLLIWLCLFGALGWTEPSTAIAIVGYGLALGLTTLGLLSSTFHLGHPERAWRAFSQWRSSWLSREGVMAVATYPPALLATLATLIGWDGLWVTLLELITILCAIGTIWCTGMIYACLTTIRAWNRPHVPWIYLILGLGTGALLATLLFLIFGGPATAAAICTTLFLAIALAGKLHYWRDVDALEGSGPTAADATGLRHLGEVRELDPPHTMDNYIMREMGYAIGRKHAEKLRLIAILSLVCAAGLALFLAAFPTSSTAAMFTGLCAVCAGGIGVVVERWLFFAEAKHVVTLYYGANSA